MQTRTSLALGAVLASGCITLPNDGDTVRRDQPVSLSGYVLTPNQPVQVQALNTGTLRFDNVADTLSVTESPQDAFNLSWFSWSVRAPLGDQYWKAGRTGASARLRARIFTGDPAPFNLYTFPEFGLGCALASGSLGSAADACAAPRLGELTVCTPDFTPFGSRRGPCRGRSLYVGDGRSLVRIFSLPDTTSSALLPAGATRLEWRGDRVSFIDIFDQPFNRPYEHRNLAGEGMLFSSFVRVPFRPQADRNTPQLLDEATARALVSAVDSRLTWGGAVGFRQYDQGECSQLVTWRELIDRLVPFLERSVAHIALPRVTIRARPLSRVALTPVLRLNGDAVLFTESFSLAAGTDTGPVAAGRIDVQLRLALSTAGGAFGPNIETVKATYTDAALPTIARLFGAPGPAEVEASAAQAIRDLAVGALGPIAGTGIVLRAHARPEGVEFVLAESSDDPRHRGYAEQGLCARPSAGGEPLAGYFDGVFDPQGPGDPPVFGN